MKLPRVDTGHRERYCEEFLRRFRAATVSDAPNKMTRNLWFCSHTHNGSLRPCVARLIDALLFHGLRQALRCHSGPRGTASDGSHSLCFSAINLLSFKISTFVFLRVARGIEFFGMSVQTSGLSVRIFVEALFQEWDFSRKYQPKVKEKLNRIWRSSPAD